MISLLRGEVAVRRDDYVIVVCAGVGYRVAVSSQTMRHVPAIGADVTLHTQLIVRDDAMQLYGFANELERDLFLLLLGVQNVGPKVALAVLSGGPISDLLGAIAAADVAHFKAVPGVGKRTAERIIVELKEKVGGLGCDFAFPSTAGGQSSKGEQVSSQTLARDGLIALGFTEQESNRLLRGRTESSPEGLIAAALREARS